ncbi:MAG: hypothetical protein V3T72_17890 [Thermoanaerobaculia bacterium]
MRRPIIITDRAAIEARADWYLRELTGHLAAAALAKGRAAVDLPDPLTFSALLTLLDEIEIEPRGFFRGVLRRWRRVDVARRKMAAAGRRVNVMDKPPCG